jgi:hypothetical protein
MKCTNLLWSDLGFKNLDDEYERLKKEEVEFVSEPVILRFRNGAGSKFCCFKDLDARSSNRSSPFKVKAAPTLLMFFWCNSERLQFAPTRASPPRRLLC